MIIWDSREENKHDLKTFHLKYTSFQMVFTKYPLHSVTLNSDQNSISQPPKQRGKDVQA